MGKKYILKEQALFLMEFYSKIFNKEIPISFQLVDKSLSGKGYVISLNPFMNNSVSVDRYFETECKNVKSIIGLKKKAVEEFKNTGQSDFNISQVTLDKIDDFAVIPVRNTAYWEQNIDKYLEFIDFACDRMKSRNYDNDYLSLIWTLTNKSYFDFVNDIPGLERKIEKKLKDNHFLDNPFWHSYKTMLGEEPSYIRLNANILISRNLERFYDLDERRDPIFDNKDWRKYYLSGVFNALLDNDVSLLKFYENDASFKSSLDFLVKEYSDEIPEALSQFFKENKIGQRKLVSDDIFLSDNQKESISVVLTLAKVKEAVPLRLYDRSDFKSTLAFVIAGVINNTTNNVQAKTFMADSEMLINILSDGEKPKEYFLEIIKKCVDEINILSVESHRAIVIDKISMLVNEMIMNKDSQDNFNNMKTSKIRKM